MAAKIQGMTSHEISEILRASHSKDVFVDECKDGPTWSGSHARMDAWVMTRSWSNLLFTGYEIKVSRNDFKQDNKWHSYLPLCNQLWFVCPKDLIKPEEVPAGVGLKYATQGRCRVVVKAAHRDVQPPMELFCYLLMARTRVVRGGYYADETPESKVEKYKNWLALKEEERKVGHIVRYQVAVQIDRMVEENARLKERLDFIVKAEKALASMGVRRTWNDSEDAIRQQAKRFLEVVPEQFVRELKSLTATANALLIDIEQKNKDATKPENPCASNCLDVRQPCGQF